MLHALVVAIAIAVVGITTGRLVAFSLGTLLAVGFAIAVTALAIVFVI